MSNTPRCIAVFSAHTSPLDPPGSGDAGGMNVYIRQTSERLAARGIEVDVYTRATDPDAAPVVSPVDGVRVIHVPAGPFQGLRKEDLPAQLLALTVGVQDMSQQLGAQYDLIHSHYWLSGQVGWACAQRWQVPLVHTMHTMAKVKNLALAAGDTPEPQARINGEEQVVAAAKLLIANTHREASELIEHYEAMPELVRVVHPGVDLDVFKPADGKLNSRSRVGWSPEDFVVLFVGRLQPLKAPDLLVKAIAELPERVDGKRVRAVICGGPSGSGLDSLIQLQQLAVSLGVTDRVDFLPPQSAQDLADLYRASDVVAVPSYSESFGLVAVEAQACGTPVVAAAVGGLLTAVKNEYSGVLVAKHETRCWADAISRLASDEALLCRLAVGALTHAHRFSWEHTASGLMSAYQQLLAGNQVRRG